MEAPVFEGAAVERTYCIEFQHYNANWEKLYFEEANHPEMKYRTIPKYLEFHFIQQGTGKGLQYNITMDEEEIFNAFEELFTDPENQEGELVLNVRDLADI